MSSVSVVPAHRAYVPNEAVRQPAVTARAANHDIYVDKMDNSSSVATAKRVAQAPLVNAEPGVVAVNGKGASSFWSTVGAILGTLIPIAVGILIIGGAIACPPFAGALAFTALGLYISGTISFGVIVGVGGAAVGGLLLSWVGHLFGKCFP